MELKTSRSLGDAHEELHERWDWIVDTYAERYPGAPLPQVSCTYRDEATQKRDVESGASKVGFPNSTHNVYPSLALDFFFTEDGKTSYRDDWMDRVLLLSQEAGLFSGYLEWGWDKPHLALCEKPSDWPKDLPPLPEDELSTRLENVPRIVLHNATGRAPNIVTGEEGEDILLRVSFSHKKVDVRFDGLTPPILVASPKAIGKITKNFRPRPGDIIVVDTKGEKMQPQDTDPAEVAKLRGMANRAIEGKNDYKTSEKEPILQYVVLIGPIVSSVGAFLYTAGVIQYTPAQVTEFWQMLESAFAVMFPIVTVIMATFARSKAFSQASVDKKLAALRAGLKR